MEAMQFVTVENKRTTNDTKPSLYLKCQVKIAYRYDVNYTFDSLYTVHLDIFNT